MRLKLFIEIEPIKRDAFKDLEIYDSDSEEENINSVVSDILEKTEDKKESLSLFSKSIIINKEITCEIKTPEFTFKLNKNFKKLVENHNQSEKKKDNTFNRLDDEFDGYESYVSMESGHEIDNDGYKNDISLDEIDSEDK